VNPLSSKDSVFLLEEVFQLLRESLEHDPFRQSKYQPTKKHIARFRSLLGPEFSFLLAETGNLFYAVLHSTKTLIDQEFNMQTPDAIEAKNIYSQLLLTSHLVMNTGIQSEQSINALLDLDQLADGQTETISDVLENTLSKLQKYICKLANP